MKSLISLTAAAIIACTSLGCVDKTTSEKKAVVTEKTPTGEKETTVHQKVETTPDSTTRTTTEKTETKP